MMSNSSDIVDWITFSLPLYPDSSDVYGRTMATITHTIPPLGGLFESLEFAETSGRAPFDRSYSALGFRVFTGANVQVISIEVSGMGCKMLREHGLMAVVLEAIASRVSRIDIATDIECQLRPDEFVGAGYSNRIRSIGQVTSESGQTFYIGSQKSDRYARVYRYNQPHPRSHLMRIEYVFRRKEAKKTAQMIVNNGINEVSKMAHKTYDWKHDILNGLISDDRLTATVAHRESAKTLRWILKQCVPAFQKLVEQGVIENPVEFLNENFLSGIGDKSNE